MRALVCADSRGAFPCRERLIQLQEPILLVDLIRQLEKDLEVDLLPKMPGYWFIFLLNQNIITPDAQILIHDEDTLLVYPGPLAGG